MIDAIKKKALELFKNKEVSVVIGYQRASDGISAQPCFISDEKDINKLIWDSYCVYNLSNYLNDFSGQKVGLIAKACDVKSIIVLLQENQLKRENVFIIGVECPGMIDEQRLRSSGQQDQDLGFDEKCRKCQTMTPTVYDFLVKNDDQKEKVAKTDTDSYDAVRKLEAKSIEERFKYWQEEFSRCIRCYACRQICPMCYCPTCVTDQTQPFWFSKVANLEGNFSWNVVRAMHLAGRCVDCGECERACPVGIPLREINRKIAKDIKELFNYEAGLNDVQKPFMSSFDKNDPDSFIR